MHKIALVGCGNLAKCLAQGLANKDEFKIYVFDIDISQAQRLQRDNPQVHVCSNIEDLVCESDAIVACVKPQHTRDALRACQPWLNDAQALISVAAGINAMTLQRWSGVKQWIRGMPNLPITVDLGMTALYATSNVTKAQQSLATSIFEAVGKVLWVEDEQKMSLITALSGSGPAYFFYVLKALHDAAKALGLEDEQARYLISQTALGAITLTQHSNEDWSSWCEKVASKGGTTEQALNVLEQQNVAQAFKDAIEAASKRCDEMTQIFDRE